MATVKFRVKKGKSDPAPIKVYISLGRGNMPEKNTGLTIQRKDWSNATGYPKQNIAENKLITKQLRGLSSFLYNQLNAPQETINNDWLLNEIDIYFNRKSRSEHSDSVIYWIDHLIKTADTRENGKKVGLSKSRIGQYKRLKELFTEFQGRNRFLIKDVNIQLGKDFFRFLYKTKNFGEAYSRKMVSNLKSVCKEAEDYNIETSSFRNIKSGVPEADTPIYLSPQELQKIAAAVIRQPHLQNARKWLLLGCWIGQRGGDLINVSEKSIVEEQGMKVFKIKQQKTGKTVYVPVLPQAQEIIDSGFPYKVSTQNLNYYFKDICELAEINEPIEGSKLNPKTNRKEAGTYLKYELIGTHVCRRSFCTNLYGELSTPVIMQASGHAKEKTFLSYIGKEGMDFKKHWVDFMDKLKI